MFGSWRLEYLSVRDGSIDGAVKFHMNGTAFYVECLDFVPLKKISIGNDQFSLVKLSADETRIKYTLGLEHPGIISKLIWYIGEYRIGKWDLHNSRMTALADYLAGHNQA